MRGKRAERSELHEPTELTSAAAPGWPTLRAPWRITAELGAGATSQVYRGEHASSGAACAIKFANEPAWLADEARWLAVLTRAHGPQLLDAGVADTASGPRPYLVMSLAEGAPLQTSEPRSWPARLVLAERVALASSAALAELHIHGVRHGDVKPANLVLDGAHVSLLDFGLAAAVGAIATGGSPRYLAPEALQGHPLGPAADMYALGVVLAEVLLGADALELPQSQFAGRLVPSLHALRARAPEFIELACALLHEHPGMRPSAQLLLAKLHKTPSAEGAALASEQIESRLRTSYLLARADELHAGAEVAGELQGMPAIWLKAAIARLGEAPVDIEPVAKRSALAIMTPLRRALWLASVARMALVPALGAGVDEAAIAEQLLASGRVDSRVDAPAAVDASAREWRELAQTAQIPGAWLIQAQCVAASLDLERRELAVHALRNRGDLPAAYALAAAGGDAVSQLLAADCARRAGRLHIAQQHLAAAGTDLGPTWQPRARALAARCAWDAGDHAQAATLADDAQQPVWEVRGLLAVGTPAAEQIVAQLTSVAALPQPALERARLLGVVAMLEHARGAARAALAAFSAAAELAVLSGALPEEASYRTGEAAAATDAGVVDVALAAATRAALLWEQLGEPARAARALLARAVLLALLGEVSLAAESAKAAESRAHADPLARAYAWLAQAELVPVFAAIPASTADSMHATQAAEASEAAVAKLLHDACELLHDASSSQRAPIVAEGLRRGIWAEDSAPVLGLGAETHGLHGEWAFLRARLWRARAQPKEPAVAALLASLLSMGAHKVGPIALRGPALQIGRDLAMSRGDGDMARKLERQRAELAESVRASVPPAHLAAHAQAAWAGPRAPDTGLGERLDELAQIGAMLSERSSLRRLFEHVLDAMVQWTSAERGLLLARAPGGKLALRATRNLGRRELDADQLHVSRTLAERALSSGEVVVARDALATFGDMHASVMALKLRSVLAVPLVVQGETLGVAYLDDRQRVGLFGTRELAWVKLVAGQAAIAIRDARAQAMLRRAARKAARAEARLASLLAEREQELVVTKVELQRVRRETRHDYASIIGRSPQMRALLRTVDKVAEVAMPVLILGESGTGKELIARAIHDASPRAACAFVGENCGAIPEPLLESTLFGHARGAFTGANRDHIGLFEAAHGGTLFLDEIGEMSLAMQTKLLRVVQDGEVRPVGSERVRKVDVRLVAATHRDLQALVREGRFREDLFYRLDVVTLRLPALRERTLDIPDLVTYFVAKYRQSPDVRIAPEVMQAFAAYEWPGNVRQLENEVRRALVLSEGTLQVSDLSPALHVALGGAAQDAGRGLGLRSRVGRLERGLVEDALRRLGGNQTKVAQELEISRFGLQKMMKRLGIGTPAP